MKPTPDEIRGCAQSVIRTVTLWQANNSFVVQDKVAEVIQDFLSREAGRDPRNHFNACNECSPVMCCSGRDCGCMGMPVDFEPTEKCGDDCLIKMHKQLKDLNILYKEKDQTATTFMNQVKRLQQDLAVTQDERDEYKAICKRRDATVNQQGEEWVKLKTEIDRLREALEGISNMPSYDQDDVHRLRNIAKQALSEAKPLIT